MSEQQTEIQDDAAALASFNEGYNGTRDEKSPVEVVEKEEAVIAAEKEPIATPEPELNVKDLADELKALKAKVSASSGNDPEIVRKMHGEIGNINRTLKKLEKKVAKDAPANDELAAALTAAESVSEAFPEIAGPLVKAIKAIHADRKKEHEEEDVEKPTPINSDDIRKTAAVEALKEEHPDYYTIQDTPEFKSWFASKAPEYQEKLMNTWNPAVVAKNLDEFKVSLKAKEKKQNKLANAVVIQGGAQKPKPGVISDDEAFDLGYNSGHKRQIHRG